MHRFVLSFLFIFVYSLTALEVEAIENNTLEMNRVDSVSPKVVGPENNTTPDKITSKNHLIESTSNVADQPQAINNTFQTSLSQVNNNESILRMFLALAVIVILIFIVIWMLKKIGYQGYSANTSIKMKSCLPLSAKEKLMLIEVGGEQILIGTAPGFIGHIKTLESPIVESKEENNTHSLFSEKLKSIMLKKDTIE